MKQYLGKGKDVPRTLVFCLYKKECANLHMRLAREWPAVCIHGDMSQFDREKSVDAFKKGTSRILIATDVARAVSISRRLSTSSITRFRSRRKITFTESVVPDVRGDRFGSHLLHGARQGAGGELVSVLRKRRRGPRRSHKVWYAREEEGEQTVRGALQGG